MPIDDEETLHALEGGRADGPAPGAEMQAAPADDWDGPHQVHPSDRARPGVGQASRGVITLLLGASVILFLSVWLGSPGPRDVRSFLAAMSGTAFLALILAMVGVVSHRISRLDRTPAEGSGEKLKVAPAWVRFLLAVMDAIGRLGN